VPIASPRYAFNATMIAGAPPDPGVFALWENDELIYYGRAAGSLKSIQFALLEHLAGRAGPCTHRATHYGWEITLDPAAREAELLAEYKAAFNRLPRCNRAGG